MVRTGRPQVAENKRKSIKYSIRLDSEMEKRLVAYCDKNGITKGEAIRRAIELLIEQ